MGKCSFAECHPVDRTRNTGRSRLPTPLLESPIMIEAFLVPERTVVNAKGDGPALDVSRAEGRIFLLTLAITNIIEQESLDVGIYASVDGATWDLKPVVAFPQKFY